MVASLVWPKISIITPSYNQGNFIEETIRSVLSQNYPNLEYIIIDGGSTDNSVEIIKKYEHHLTDWVSEPDRGQSHAINKGLAKATGEIMGWLNSDDLYLPGALHQVAQYFHRFPKVDLLTGAWIAYLSDTGKIIPTRACGVGIPPSMPILLSNLAYLGQHSTFWQKRVWEQVGPLDESLHYAMDHDFFLRACDQGVRFGLTAYPLAAFRRHSEQKTNTFNQYAVESRKCIAQYTSRPEWQTPIGQLKLKVAKAVHSLSHHRNIHPRLGLCPQVDRDHLAMWLANLKS